MSKIKIIRSWWGDHQDKWVDIPKLPLYENEIVYVWGDNNKEELESRGYTCISMSDQEFKGSNIFGRKLQVLDIALKHWGEVLMLDWDCFILKPLDLIFRQLLNNKPVQVPLYAHYKEPMSALLDAIPENHPMLLNEESYFYLIDSLSTLESQIQHYHWKWNDGLVIPNFGCVYSRDKNLGKDLLKITRDNNIKGLVEEFAMWKYANCSMEEYIERFHPNYVLGVSYQRLKGEEVIKVLQSKFNDYLRTQIDYKPYLEHI